LIVMSKSSKVPLKFFESFSNIPSKLFQYSFKVLWSFLQSSLKLLSKTFEFIGKNNFQIVFKLLENSVFFFKDAKFPGSPLYTPPIFPQLWIYFMIKNRQIIFPKVIYRTRPQNAFMNAYF
jgi:hypothetical protein